MILVAYFMMFTCEVKYRLFREKKIGFDNSFDVTKCLQQIKIPGLLPMCAPCSELPSYISTTLSIDNVITCKKCVLFFGISRTLICFYLNVVSIYQGIENVGHILSFLQKIKLSLPFLSCFSLSLSLSF